MRGAMTGVITILTLCLVYGPGLAQTGGKSPTPCIMFRGACDVPALESVHMVDAQTGWALTYGGADALLRTTDGGTHWTDVTPVGSTGKKVDPWRITALSSLSVWVMPSGPVGSTTTEVLRTVDGGRTWGSAAIKAPLVESVFFINPREGWLTAFLGAAMGRQDVEIYRSTDGGESWIKVAETGTASELPLYGSKDNITFLNATTGWIVVSGIQGSLLYVTHDGGRTWREQTLPLLPSPEGQQNPPLPPEVKSRWVASPWQPKFFTARDGIMRADYTHYLLNESTGDQQITAAVYVYYATYDGGTTWAYTTPVPIRHTDDRRQSSGSFADMNHGWVRVGDLLYVTTDGGRGWTSIRPSSNFVDVKQIDFISPQVGWAVSKISPYLLKTQDGGRTWMPVNYAISR